MPTGKSRQTPPYVPFSVFKATIEQLAESTVPTGPLDRRVLDKLSDADHSALMSGLKFLGFVDDDRKATAAYHKLVGLSTKDKPKFREYLLDTITTKYKPIVGSVDLKGGNITELEKAFSDYGVSTRQMLAKAIRFFTKALTECGVQVSPFITGRLPPRAPAPSKTGGEKTRRRGNPEIRAESNGASPGFERVPLPGVANAYIQYPVALTESHCKLFEAMIGVLRTYVQSQGLGKKGKR